MLPEQWRGRLRVPVIAAPMTDVSGPGLVAAACAAGVIGAFPAHNARDGADLRRWLEEIAGRTAELTPTGARPAPVGVNLVVHRSNARLKDDLKAVIAGGAELVVASVGSPADIVGPLHDAGITVLADVANERHVERAREAGVDGVVLLSAGAGGQTGWANPIAFLRAVRQRYDGIVVAAGGISDGAGIVAAQVLGADLAYLGTRFIATTESLAAPGYRAAVVAATLDGISTSTQVTGLAANVLNEWLRCQETNTATNTAANTATNAVTNAATDDGTGASGRPAAFSMDRLLAGRGAWAAGHSAAAVHDVVGVAGLVSRLEQELQQAHAALAGRWAQPLATAGAGGE
jgi:nitronate monooxygenase